MGRVIGILSLKGGVGKTSTVVALGNAIAGFGKKVLLIDGNLSAPNLGLHLDIITPEVTLHEVLKGENTLSQSIHDKGLFDVIPASMFNRSKINPLKLRDKIKFAKRKYDIILIDSSPSLNEETLAVMLASDDILLVTTPDIPTLSTTMKAAKLAKNRGTPISGLILNKAYNKNFELSLKDIEDTSQVPVMAVIPYDIDILRSLSEFVPSTAYKPNSKATEEYKRLAAALIGQKYSPMKLKSILGWINPPKQEINRTIFYERVFD